MKDKLFKMYIDNIKKEDVINYCKQNSLNVTTKDIDFTYSYIKSIKDFSNIDNHINTLKLLRCVIVRKLPFEKDVDASTKKS